MRVTNNMMNNQVVFNLQRSLQSFMNLQTQMSSGKRINKPSDDPVGTLRDLDYRTELSKISQYQDNVSQGQNWLANYDGIYASFRGHGKRPVYRNRSLLITGQAQLSFVVG